MTMYLQCFPSSCMDPWWDVASLLRTLGVVLLVLLHCCMAARSPSVWQEEQWVAAVTPAEHSNRSCLWQQE